MLICNILLLGKKKRYSKHFATFPFIRNPFLYILFFIYNKKIKLWQLLNRNSPWLISESWPVLDNGAMCKNLFEGHNKFLDKKWFKICQFRMRISAYFIANFFLEYQKMILKFDWAIRHLILNVYISMMRDTIYS